MSPKLANKIALVPNGATGPGFSAAQNLIADGAYVYITGQSRPSLERAASTLGPLATAVECDVSSLSDLDLLLTRIIKEHGRLDMVISDIAEAHPDPTTEYHQSWYAAGIEEELATA